MVLGAFVGIGTRLLPLVIRTGTRFGTRSVMRSPNLGTSSFRMRYGKLSPLAKRSVESLLGGVISGQALSYLNNRPIRKYKSNRINYKLMPYGYGRRTYGRSYSRYPRYQSRYSRPMYRRRSYRRF